jgi:uncharacterized protein (TIGR00299 family) protein
MKTAYLDCFSGVSGDMFIGALLDAGLPLGKLEQALHTLPLTGYTLHPKRETRQSLSGTRFTVNAETGKHPHRRLNDIKKIIQNSALSENVKEKSARIFESIADEEAKIHGLSPHDLHFHEVGAVDSIVDIVGTVFGIEFLGIESLFVSSLPLGSGFVDTSHGRIPVPAPATIALLKGVPVYDSGLPYELVTPTGAALVRELATSFGAMPPMIVNTIGYGVGSRDLPDRPNILRILIGKTQADKQVETVVLLETNLDDTNPEWLGFMMDRLFEAGALVVVFYQIQIKKNRPGIHIEVMASPLQMDALMEIIFQESTTLGIRFNYNQRTILKRSATNIDSPWGKMDVKKVIRPDGTSFLLPEFETCRKIAKANNLPLKEIYHWVTSANKT